MEEVRSGADFPGSEPSIPMINADALTWLPKFGRSRTQITRNILVNALNLRHDSPDSIFVRSLSAFTISCPAIGFISQPRGIPKSEIVLLLTHIRDCGATFDRDRVHWSIHAEMSLSLGLCMNSEGGNCVKQDWIWLLRNFDDKEFKPKTR
jgi:hypothetical protein